MVGGEALCLLHAVVGDLGLYRFVRDSGFAETQ